MHNHDTITAQLRASVLAAGPLEPTALAAGVGYQTIHRFAHGGGIHGISIDRLATHFGLRLARKKKSRNSAESV